MKVEKRNGTYKEMLKKTVKVELLKSEEFGTDLPL
jgi:hypothetical protein